MYMCARVSVLSFCGQSGFGKPAEWQKHKRTLKISWKFCFDSFQAMQDICRALLGRKCLFGVSPIWSPQAGQDLNRFVVQFRYHLSFVVGYTPWPIRRATLWRHTAIYIYIYIYTYILVYMKQNYIYLCFNL